MDIGRLQQEESEILRGFLDGVAVDDQSALTGAVVEAWHSSEQICAGPRQMTFDDIVGGAVPHAVTITGSRCTDHRELAEYRLLFDAYLRPFADEGSHIYVGGAPGIDTLALDWLAEHTPAALTVVVPCMLADQPEQARQTVLSATRRAQRVSLVELGAPQLGAEAYHSRNRWMVDRSGLVIGFPRGDDPRSGTWYTIHYGADQGRPRLIVPI